MRSQREWSEKWGALNDPKMYLGEAGPVQFQPQKSVKAHIDILHFETDLKFIIANQMVSVQYHKSS